MFGAEYNVNSPEILATNGQIHSEVTQLFGEVFAGRLAEDLPSPEEYQHSRASFNG
jgi:hypothetical protein